MDADVGSGSLKDSFFFFSFLVVFCTGRSCLGLPYNLLLFSLLFFLARRCRFDADSSAVYSMG